MFKAEGQLRHQFHDAYRAVIALSFVDEREALAALPLLGDGWVQASKSTHALVWYGASEALENVKATLAGFSLQIIPCAWGHCRKQCRDAAIDSLAHSIDYGPAFTVTVGMPTEVGLSDEVSRGLKEARARKRSEAGRKAAATRKARKVSP